LPASAQTTAPSGGGQVTTPSGQNSVGLADQQERATDLRDGKQMADDFVILGLLAGVAIDL
jgi:hypothetical protein